MSAADEPAIGEELAKYSAGAANAAGALRERIRAEIDALGAHDWAGDYYAGDGLGVNMALLLAPDAGFVFEWHGCLRLYDRNYGAVASEGDRLRLVFTFENAQDGFRGIAPELVRVSWGPRRYLIPADDVVGFCNSVNGGAEPRTSVHGLHLLRRGDEGRGTAGRPELPDEYWGYLLAETVTARAVGPPTTQPTIGGLAFKDTRLALDAGTDHGLKVGMKLFVTDPPDYVESVRITKVRERTAEAVMSQVGEASPDPKAGWRFSTKAPWRE